MEIVKIFKEVNRSVINDVAKEKRGVIAPPRNILSTSVNIESYVELCPREVGHLGNVQ